MTIPKISVVIPTHQRRWLLEQVIHMLAKQTFPADGYEVIVVVDGSTDGTMEMLQRLDTPMDLRTVYQDQSGPSVARNRGASLARADVLLFLDDDMLAEPQLLQRHWEVHSEDPCAVVIGRYAPAEGERTAGQGGWSAWEAEVLKKHFEAMRSGRRPAGGRRLYSGNFSVRTALYRRIGGFDEELKRGEDVEIGLRLQDAGGHFHYAPDAAGAHCGFRTFESWTRSAHSYGSIDVLLTQEKGRRTLGLILSWFHRQNLLVRVGLGVGLKRPWTQRTAVRALRLVANGLMRAGLRPAALACYGAIYKLMYWQGVMDQLGGRDAFWTSIRQSRDARPDDVQSSNQAA